MSYFRPTFLLILSALVLWSCSAPDRPTLELYLALNRGDINQIERHIHWGTDLNKRDVDGRTPLHVAAAQGRGVIVKLLLEHGARVGVLDSQGNSALHDAIMAGRTQVAEVLMGSGSKVDANRLLSAVVADLVINRDVMEWLAIKGADFNRHDEDGSTPLIHAIQSGSRMMVKLLLEQGAEVNAPDATGLQPLSFVDPVKDDFIYRILKQHGAP